MRTRGDDASGHVQTQLNCCFLGSEPGNRFRSRFAKRRIGFQEELDASLPPSGSDARASIIGSVVVDGGHLICRP